jgi:hypothetical protein
MDDAAEVWAGAIDLLVEREFGGGAMGAFDGAIGVDADDVFAAEGTFIDAGGGDPEVPIVLEDGEVAAGRGGHSVAIDTLDGGEDFVAGVQVGGRKGHPVSLSQVANARLQAGLLC